MNVLDAFKRRVFALENSVYARSYYGEPFPVPEAQECYGVISYLPSCNRVHYCNLGDEFQSIAASQFLPRIDAYIPRDNLDRIYPLEVAHQIKKTKLIMAARFYGYPASWPPPPHLDPVFVGVRLETNNASHRKIFLKNGMVEFLNCHGPIGCRDLSTADFLEGIGVKTVLTGCITLTLQRDQFINKTIDSGEEILFIDVPSSILGFLPTGICRKAKWLTQILPRTSIKRQSYRTEMAMARLRELASAKLVVTTKVHATLPCVAFGTPVVLLDSGGDISCRIQGMQDLFHYIDLSSNDVHERFSHFPWHEPPPNPDPEGCSILAQRTVDILTKHGLVSNMSEECR